MNKYEIMFIVKSDLEEEARKNAVKIAMPPNLGMGFLCIRRLSLGTSMAPTRKAKLFATGVNINDSAIAKTKAKTAKKICVRSIILFLNYPAIKPIFL